MEPLFDYRSERGAFVGCPGDAEGWAERLVDVYKGLLIPGARKTLYHWRKDFDGSRFTAAVGSQYHIQQTSHPACDPVFILFADTIGTPVCAPPDGWEPMRQWLDGNGFPFVALLGEERFRDKEQVPDGCVPMTGTLFELFDAMRMGAKKHLWIIQAPHPLLSRAVGGAAAAPFDLEWCERQRGWRDQVKAALGSTILPPIDEAHFERWVKRALCDAFHIGQLDPRHDVLPGLEALSDDRASLLFGRADLIRELERRVLADGDALTPLSGVTGAGKSSLLRAGLMGEWFLTMPRGAGLAHGATAVLFEPALLQLQGEEDPLESFSAVLAGKRATVGRIVGPLPSGFPQAAQIAVPGLTGDVRKDAAASLDWWELAVPKGSSPLVLMLDQAEQIEAIARSEAQRQAERTGADSTEPRLSSGWLRFAALIALLAGVGDEARLGREQIERAAALTRDHRPVRVILSLHRVSAIDLWPMDRMRRPAPFKVPPLIQPQQFREIIGGTCRAYGLTMNPDLLGEMIQEADRLANQRQRVAAQAGVEDRDTGPENASVLPLVVTALQRILSLWRTSSW